MPIANTYSKCPKINLAKIVDLPHNFKLEATPCADPRPAVVMKRAKRAKFVTSRAEECWRYARQCLEIAPTFQDKEARATVLGFARAWLRLAYLAQANRHIAELTVQVARQRAIVKSLDTGEGSEMAESLFDALEGSLRIFEKHRIFLLSLRRQP